VNVSQPVLGDVAPEAWERQPGESAKAFAAFSAYRDTAPSKRSTRGLAVDLGKSYAIVARWSRTWGWGARSAAYDAHLDRRRVQERLEKARDLDETHLATGEFLRQKGVELIRNMEMSPSVASAAAQAIGAGAKLARLAGGLTTANTAAQVAVTLPADDDAARAQRAETNQMLADPEIAEHLEEIYMRQRELAGSPPVTYDRPLRSVPALPSPAADEAP
jgi:hypothetical protein